MAYEMRISDWVSDVCSSDLVGIGDAPASAEPPVAVQDDADVPRQPAAAKLRHQAAFVEAVEDALDPLSEAGQAPPFPARRGAALRRSGRLLPVARSEHLLVRHLIGQFKSLAHLAMRRTSETSSGARA